MDEAVYEPFVERVVARTRAVRQGMAVGDDIGSMTFPPQLDTVERHVADALDRGARALTGGRRVEGRDGLWYEPTVLVDVDHDMAVMRDETFGPVLPIMAVSGPDEALALANDSRLRPQLVGVDRRPGPGRGPGRRSGGGQRVRERRDRVLRRAGPALRRGQGVGHRAGARPRGAARVQPGEVGAHRPLRPARELWWFPTPKPLGAVGARLLRLRHRRGLGHKLRALLP